MVFTRGPMLGWLATAARIVLGEPLCKVIWPLRVVASCTFSLFCRVNLRIGAGKEQDRGKENIEDGPVR